MVKRQIPQVIQEASVFINGQGYLGVVKFSLYQTSQRRQSGQEISRSV